MRILHLSDPHIGRDGAVGSLRLMLGELRQPRGVDAVVVTGDLADDGATEAYATVRTRVGDFARPLGAPVFHTTGDHDERSAFAKVPGSGHPEGAVAFPGEERAAVSEVGGWRFVTLDSLVPGRVGSSRLRGTRYCRRHPGRFRLLNSINLHTLA